MPLGKAQVKGQHMVCSLNVNRVEGEAVACLFISEFKVKIKYIPRKKNVFLCAMSFDIFP